MTPLARKLATLIEAGGPMSIADYMAACLLDPDHGYYATREPFGAGGDFTTAPEISQMFGELVAIWLYSAWRAAGAPAPFSIAEIGPGRATLMKDMVRTWRRLDPVFAAAMNVGLVEASPRLAAIQRHTLAGAATRVEWHDAVRNLPDLPTFLVGNEIFDAIPARQFVKSGKTWRERCIGLGAGGELTFMLGAATLDPSLLPISADRSDDGTVFEFAPAREALMDEMAERIARDGGAALFFDYGHLDQGFGDTFQAVRRHRPADVLAEPGEADLTSHVDFAALAEIARQHRLSADTMTQGDFLRAMGLAERAGRLGEAASQAVRERLASEVERLSADAAMGSLFKVLAVTPKGLAVHPFAAAD